MATLILIVCVAIGNPATCTHIPITVTDLTMDLCKGIPGQTIAQMHWQRFYSDQEFGGWTCVSFTVPEQAA